MDATLLNRLARILLQIADFEDAVGHPYGPRPLNGESGQNLRPDNPNWAAIPVHYLERWFRLLHGFNRHLEPAERTADGLRELCLGVLADSCTPGDAAADLVRAAVVMLNERIRSLPTVCAHAWENFAIDRDNGGAMADDARCAHDECLERRIRTGELRLAARELELVVLQLTRPDTSSTNLECQLALEVRESQVETANRNIFDMKVGLIAERRERLQSAAEAVAGSIQMAVSAAQCEEDEFQPAPHLAHVADRLEVFAKLLTEYERGWLLDRLDWEAVRSDYMQSQSAEQARLNCGFANRLLRSAMAEEPVAGDIEQIWGSFDPDSTPASMTSFGLNYVAIVCRILAGTLDFPEQSLPEEELVGLVESVRAGFGCHCTLGIEELFRLEQDLFRLHGESSRRKLDIPLPDSISDHREETCRAWVAVIEQINLHCDRPAQTVVTAEAVGNRAAPVANDRRKGHLTLAEENNYSRWLILAEKRGLTVEAYVKSMWSGGELEEAETLIASMKKRKYRKEKKSQVGHPEI